MLSEGTLSEALNAVRWLVARNVDFAGAVHVIALLAALAEVATPAQRDQVASVVDELSKRWAYWAPDLLAKAKLHDTIPCDAPAEVA